MDKNLILLLLIPYVKCQFGEIRPRPEKCYGSPELLDFEKKKLNDYTRQCCTFPPFFKREIAKICGANVAITFINKDVNVAGLRREVNDPCEHWRCMLTKYSLLNAKERVDDVKYFTHLDKWVNLNPEFSTVMFNAKIHCKHLYRLFMPLKSCEFLHFQSCIRNYINVNCPKVILTLECRELKEFYDECREYFIDK